MSTWEELNSDKALVAHREINGEGGGAVVFSVLLSDGFLIDCGATGYAERRARIIADIINEAGPDRLSKKALRASAAITGSPA